MFHNESVNIWSHLFGVLLFIGLIVYTFLYMAPPGIYRETTDPFTHRWTVDHSLAKVKAESFYNELFSRYNMTYPDRAQNKTNRNFTKEELEAA